MDGAVQRLGLQGLGLKNASCGKPALANKGMKLSKPEYLVGGWLIRLGVTESGFAAYAQC